MKHIVGLVFLAACLQSHGDLQQLGSTDCYQCHKPDYESTPRIAKLDTAVPDHLANQALYTTQCATCHVTSTWASHPEASFAIKSGPHANIECVKCHGNVNDNTSDAHGANTMCTSCHPANEAVGAGTMQTGHSDLPMFSYSAPPAGFTAQNFCLSCHPDGREKPHDDSIFPQGHGNAQNCDSCHDRSKGSDQLGQNADCRRCHSNSRLSQVSDHPGNVTTMPSPSGCLQQGCHYGGRGGD